MEKHIFLFVVLVYWMVDLNLTTDDLSQFQSEEMLLIMKARWKVELTELRWINYILFITREELKEKYFQHEVNGDDNRQNKNHWWLSWKY